MGPLGRPYGQGCVFDFNLLDVADPDKFISGQTVLAADVLVASDTQAAAAGTAESEGFTSGSAQPRVGDAIEGNVSGATATIIGISMLASGSWGGEDAVGTVFVENVSGTFQNESVTLTRGPYTVSADAFTLDGDFSVAPAAQVGDDVTVALTSTERSCGRNRVRVIDASDDNWLEVGISIESTGHPYAMHRPEGNGYVLAFGVVGGTGNDATHVHCDGLGVAADEYAEHALMLQDANTGEWHGRYINSHTAFDDGSFPDRVTTDPNQADLPFTPVSGDLWFVLAPRRDGTPAALGSQAKNDALESASSAIGQVFSAADSEPSSVPAANATPLEKLAWIFTVLRNEITNDGATQTVRNDADDADIGSASVSKAGGVVTRGKYS